VTLRQRLQRPAVEEPVPDPPIVARWQSEPADGHRFNLSFQGRVMVTLLAAAVLPLVAFGLVLIATGAVAPDIGARVLLFMLAIAVVGVLIVGSAIALALVAPVREMSDSVARVSSGDMSEPLPVRGDDALAQLAASHNRLVADAERRTRQLTLILAAVEAARPELGVETLATTAARDAERAFGLISAAVQFLDPATVPEEERIPGVSVPVRAELRAGDERMGLLVGVLPATQPWTRADQSLLDLYATEIAVAIRDAQLFAQVASQNSQLRTLSEAKDDFLRGVSHNLQTPLTRIRSNAETLATTPDLDAADHRLSTIIEQSDRLSRMVQQLLLVSRLESQPLRPNADVLAIGPRVQRAWDALAAEDRPLEIEDRAPGWLAVADGDQLDQVLWALLDNAVKYGEGMVRVTIGVETETPTLWTTISDGGRGLEDADRAWLFERFARGAAARASGDGSGLGLYVSRALMQSMGGDLVLDPPNPGRGATFRLTLPGELASEA
jgi:K+-sensing histidine kinase KdpD